MNLTIGWGKKLKRLHILAAGAALAMILSGSGYALWHTSDAEIAKRTVLEALDDPASATFSDIEVCGDDKKEPKIVIGKVNSRSKMGGMTGKKTFVVENVSFAAYAKIESDDAFHHPNIADALVDARIFDTTFEASCSELHKKAAQSLDSQANNIDVDMNATEGADTLTGNLAELDKA